MVVNQRMVNLHPDFVLFNKTLLDIKSHHSLYRLNFDCSIISDVYKFKVRPQSKI